MHNLKEYNTFGFNINCLNLIKLTCIEDYKKFISMDKPKILIGGGSDVLFCSNFLGTVAIASNVGFSINNDDNYYYIRAEAGQNWHELISSLVQKGIGGVENLALIPGTCGAAPIQNIGAYGVEFKDVCDYVEVIDMQTQSLVKISAENCNFSYRSSNFKNIWKNKYLITAIGLKLVKQWKPNLNYSIFNEISFSQNITPLDIFKLIIKIRTEKLPNPKKYGNAGSFFKNPIVSSKFYEKLKLKHENVPAYQLDQNTYKISAGWLIEKCGLKGFRDKDAGVYSKQALVLVNYGNASPDDILNLAKKVVSTVYNEFNIKLEPEVRIIDSTEEISWTDNETP